MKAVLLAGGSGTRLMPLTKDCPKPMLSVCNRPLIDYTVAQLYNYGIKDMGLTLGYMPEKIIEWVIGYRGINASFSVEKSPLGTLGGVKALDISDDVFLVLSGDGLNNIDLNALLNRHLSTKAEVTMAVKRVDDPSLYGIADLGRDGFINGFIEKPHTVTNPSYINLGAYAVNKSALSIIEKANCDFAKDLFPVLVDDKKLAYYEHHGYWKDIGDFASYYTANFDLKSGGFYPFVNNAFEDRYASKVTGGQHSSLISKNIRLSGEVKNCIIGGGSRIIGSPVLEDCIILENTLVSGDHRSSIISQSAIINYAGI